MRKKYAFADKGISLFLLDLFDQLDNPALLGQPRQQLIAKIERMITEISDPGRQQVAHQAFVEVISTRPQTKRASTKPTKPLSTAGRRKRHSLPRKRLARNSPRRQAVVQKPASPAHPMPTSIQLVSAPLKELILRVSDRHFSPSMRARMFDDTIEEIKKIKDPTQQQAAYQSLFNTFSGVSPEQFEKMSYSEKSRLGKETLQEIRRIAPNFKILQLLEVRPQTTSRLKQDSLPDSKKTPSPTSAKSPMVSIKSVLGILNKVRLGMLDKLILRIPNQQGPSASLGLA